MSAPVAPPAPFGGRTLGSSTPRAAAFALHEAGPRILASGADSNWYTYLYSPERTAANPTERTIAVSNVSRLRPIWNVSTNDSDYSAPILVNGTVYFGSWNGYEYAVSAASGAIRWTRYLGVDPCSSLGISSAPMYVNGTLYLGGGDGYWYALNATNGSVDWRFLAGTAANGYYDWASALVYRHSLYIGLSSCFDNPLIRGGLLEVNLTGNHTASHAFYTVPSGQTGGSIWTTPAVDPATNTIWLASGNENTGYPPDTNAVIALNASTLSQLGSWQVPSVQGGDSDFGTTPTLYSTASGTPMVVATNKDEVAYAFNRSNVTNNSDWGPTWERTTGGGFASGAFDGNSLFLAGSGISALDPANGSFRWSNSTTSSVTAGLTWANGVVYVGSANTTQAFDGTTGRLLWTGWLSSNQTIEAADLVADGELIVPSGSYGAQGYVTAYALPFSARAHATPLNGTAPLEVNFTSTPAGGVLPYRFTWSFGDGSEGTGANPTHVYDRPGTFNGTGYLNDSAQGSVVVRFQVTVHNPPGEYRVHLEASPQVGVTPLSVVLTANFSNGSGGPYLFDWTFGDGQSWTGENATHVFDRPGNYTVRLNSTEGNGSSDHAEVVVRAVGPLRAAGAAIPEVGAVPLRVQFNASERGGLPPVTYQWSFGDGNGSNLSDVAYTYAGAGSYSVVLSERDALGESSTWTGTVLAESASALAVVATAMALSSVCNGANDSYADAYRLSAAASGGTPPVTFAWELSDGTRVSGATFTHTFANPPRVGWANVTATDSVGARSSYNLSLSFPAVLCPTLASPTDSLYLYAGVGILAAGVGLAAVAVLVGRRRSPPPPEFG